MIDPIVASSLKLIQLLTKGDPTCLVSGSVDLENITLLPNYQELYDTYRAAVTRYSITGSSESI